MTEIHHTLPKGHPKREYIVKKWLIHLHCHDDLHRNNPFKFFVEPDENQKDFTKDYLQVKPKEEPYDSVSIMYGSEEQ